MNDERLLFDRKLLRARRARFAHEFVVLGTTFPDSRFKAVRSIADDVRSDGME